MKTKKAFTIIEVVLVVAILAVAGLLGYLFVSRSMSSKPATTTASITVSDINSTKDIDTISTQLDSVNLDSASSSELDSINSSLNSF